MAGPWLHNTPPPNPRPEIGCLGLFSLVYRQPSSSTDKVLYRSAHLQCQFLRCHCQPHWKSQQPYWVPCPASHLCKQSMNGLNPQLLVQVMIQRDLGKDGYAHVPQMSVPPEPEQQAACLLNEPRIHSWWGAVLITVHSLKLTDVSYCTINCLLNETTATYYLQQGTMLKFGDEVRTCTKYIDTVRHTWADISCSERNENTFVCW